MCHFIAVTYATHSQNDDKFLNYWFHMYQNNSVIGGEGRACDDYHNKKLFA